MAVARYELSRRWILPAALLGAGFGALVVAAWLSAPLLVRGGTQGSFWFPATFVAAFIVWLLGIAVIGGPIWLHSERTGRRSPARAVWIGMISTFLAVTLLSLLLSANTTTAVEYGRALIIGEQRTPYGWWILARDGWLMGILGGAVGGLVWRLAYRTVGEE